jgi:hypothetical protein
MHTVFGVAHVGRPGGFTLEGQQASEQGFTTENTGGPRRTTEQLRNSGASRGRAIKHRAKRHHSLLRGPPVFSVLKTCLSCQSTEAERAIRTSWPAVQDRVDAMCDSCSRGAEVHRQWNSGSGCEVDDIMKAPEGREAGQCLSRPASPSRQGDNFATDDKTPTNDKAPRTEST